MQDHQRLKNVATFYADLVLEGCMSLEVLRPLDLPTTTAWTMKFIDQFMFDLLDGSRGKKDKGDTSIARVFGCVRDLPVLAGGLSWLLRDRSPVANRELGPKKRARLENVLEKAEAVLQRVVQGE
jgi:hypothetical protein